MQSLALCVSAPLCEQVPDHCLKVPYTPWGFSLLDSLVCNQNWDFSCLCVPCCCWRSTEHFQKDVLIWVHRQGLSLE